jgi:hypothetical protein
MSCQGSNYADWLRASNVRSEAAIPLTAKFGCGRRAPDLGIGADKKAINLPDLPRR